jgi:RNA polymerase sigma-70 factor (ECF subfamily)
LRLPPPRGGLQQRIGFRNCVALCAESCPWDGITDEEVVEGVRAGDTASYEILMRRYNQRLCHVAYSILRNDAEADDVMQEAYINAYQHLNQFAGAAKFSTWLTEIAVNEALSRVRRNGRNGGTASLDTNSSTTNSVRTGIPDPERQPYDRELKLALEGAIAALPDSYRLVFVLRAVEGLSGAETAACLDIGEEAVKTRFHRARPRLQKGLRQRGSGVTAEAFPFHLSRCDRVVNGRISKNRCRRLNRAEFQAGSRYSRI